MKHTIGLILALLFLAALLAACGTPSADVSFEAIAPARLLALQSALAVVRADLNLDQHPNPMEDDAYFKQMEPDVITLHRAAREVGDIQKDVIKAAGVTSNKYAGMDTTLAEIATNANALVDYFEHPTETSKPAFQNVQKSLNSLTVTVEKALEIYTANGGPGIPTKETKAGSTPITAGTA
jgi:hypothetical protein